MVRRHNILGTGSASVTVHGASMGLVTYTGRGREGYTGCEATDWESETSVRCLAGHGASGTRRVMMTAGKQGASVTQGWSLNMAGLSITRRANLVGTGSASVTVHGASMGLVRHTGRGRESQTGCEATEWESETSVRCLAGNGIRGTRRIALSVGEREASVTQGWSVDLAGVSVIRKINRAGTGSASVTVHGASMGLVMHTGQARVGQTGCEATEWESQTSVRCLEGHASRGTRRVVMTAGERGASVSQIWSVDVTCVGMMQKFNRAGTGSASMTVHGSSMGLLMYTGQVRGGQTGCKATEWRSETSVRCLVGHGSRGTQGVVMTANGRAASYTQGWSVDVAGLSMTRSLNRAVTGSASVTVHGASVGLVTYTGRVREGQTGCAATEWQSETSVRCHLGHGAFATRRLFLSVGQPGGSVTQAWTVDSPSLHSDFLEFAIGW